jgi:CRISPR-associated protein Cmr5
MSTIKSIEQARAKFAWDCACKSGNKASKEYESSVNKVPAYVKTNGLLNTLAFFYSKKGSGKNGEVFSNIKGWLTNEEYGLLSSTQVKTDEDLLNCLFDKQESDARFLIHCTSETLALFNWLRRFAK